MDLALVSGVPSPAMTQWEYESFHVRYVDGRGWVLWQKGYPELEGMGNILNTYGREGWELVGFETERTEAATAEKPGRVTGYRVVLKRPRGASVAATDTAPSTPSS
jgi:hypothetical protein